MSEIKYVSPSGLAHYDEKIKAVIDGKDKELSFDDYNALSDDDKNNGTTYYVPDATLGSDDVIFSVDDETLSATYDNKTIELVDGSKIQNNLTTTDEGYALDARQGNVLDTRISALETPTFTQASSRANIASGENTLTILGKIKKYFADLKSHAFNSTVNNLTTTTTGYALDATQGKALNDKLGSTDISTIGDGTVTNAISTLNSNMSEFVGFINVDYLNTCNILKSLHGVYTEPNGIQYVFTQLYCGAYALQILYANDNTSINDKVAFRVIFTEDDTRETLKWTFLKTSSVV